MGQHPRLNGLDLVWRSGQSLAAFKFAAQHDGHGFGVHRPHQIISLGCQEAKELVSPFVGLLLAAAVSPPLAANAGKESNPCDLIFQDCARKLSAPLSSIAFEILDITSELAQ